MSEQPLRGRLNPRPPSLGVRRSKNLKNQCIFFVVVFLLSSKDLTERNTNDSDMFRILDMFSVVKHETL